MPAFFSRNRKTWKKPKMRHLTDCYLSDEDYRKKLLADKEKSMIPKGPPEPEKIFQGYGSKASKAKPSKAKPSKAKTMRKKK